MRDRKTVITDNGFNAAKTLTLSDATGKEEYHRVLRGRYEGVNGRLKRFEVLTTPLRHDKDRYGLCFFAVVNIAQLAINEEEPLFDIAAPTTDGGERSEQGDSELL